MRRKILCAIMIAMFGWQGLTSCAVDEEKAVLEKNDRKVDLMVNLNFEGETRLPGLPSQKDDDCITSLDIFVFNENGSLDAYRHSGTLGTGNFLIETTQGKKTVSVVANAHDMSLGSILSYNDLVKVSSLLKNEKQKEFTMYGEAPCTVNENAEATVTISRLVAKIAVSGIKTDFAGTPYEGKELTDCKLYVINAHGKKQLGNNGAGNPELVLNKYKCIPSDVSSMTQPVLLKDDLKVSVNDAVYNSPHSFYVYSNETDDVKECTKLVLEGKLDGKVWYYPILVNQKGYGYKSSNGHFGVRPNTYYSYGITILRQGSPDPNVPLDPGTLDLTINVAEWSVIPHFDKVF